MGKSIFDPASQQKNVPAKIVAGLGRISEAFKVLLWEKAKQLGLSPIQIQILIFIAYHKAELCNVSHLAREFNVTKPTVSDAVRVLEEKKIILKDFSSSDNRSYSIRLSKAGQKVVEETENFADPIKDELQRIDENSLADLLGTLSKLIYQLNRNGILTVQRTCYGCKYYEHTKKRDYCTFLEKPLLRSDIRLDCPEYEEK